MLPNGCASMCIGESRRGITPPRAPRTVRDSLKSYGSRCSAIRMQKAPMSEKMRSGSDYPRQPVSCAFGPLAQPFELIAGPADQESIDTMQGRGQFRLVEMTVVVDPALDVRSKHPRQIRQGFVGPMVQRPPPDRLPNRLQRLRTSRWQEGGDIATAMPDRLSRTKGVSRPAGFHRQPLVEPCVNFSAHTAPIRQTCRSCRSASERRGSSCPVQVVAENDLHGFCVP